MNWYSILIFVLGVFAGCVLVKLEDHVRTFRISRKIKAIILVVPEVRAIFMKRAGTEITVHIILPTDYNNVQVRNAIYRREIGVHDAFPKFTFDFHVSVRRDLENSGYTAIYRKPDSSKTFAAQ